LPGHAQLFTNKPVFAPEICEPPIHGIETAL
jgi:hypothetical protein